MTDKDKSPEPDASPAEQDAGEAGLSRLDRATYNHDEFRHLPGVDVRGSLPHRHHGQPH